MAIRNKPTAHWRIHPVPNTKRDRGDTESESVLQPLAPELCTRSTEKPSLKRETEEPSLRKMLQEVIKNASCEQKKNGRSLLSEKYLIMWHLQLYKYHTLFLSILVGSMENRIYLNSFTLEHKSTIGECICGKSYITVATINNKIQISINHLKTKYCKNHVSWRSALNARSQKVYIKNHTMSQPAHHRNQNTIELSGLNNRNFFLTVLEPGNSKMKVLAGKFHSESFFSWCRHVPSHRVFSWPILRAHVGEKCELSDVCPP